MCDVFDSVCSPGIPFVFPQFGDWMYGPNGPPNNGFARISRWQLEKVNFKLVKIVFKFS